MKELIEKIKMVEHGFKHIIKAGDIILADTSIPHFELATYLFGQLLLDNAKHLKC